MKDHPGTYGAELCEELAGAIQRSHLRLEVEQVNLPGQPILGHLAFRNLRKVHFKVVRLAKEDQEKLDNQLQGERALDFLNNKKPVRTWTESLPDPQGFSPPTGLK